MSPETALPEAPRLKQFYGNERRFRTAPRTHGIDRFMTHFIKVGGVSIIVAVLGIFVFIFLQVIPLFRGARVNPGAVLNAGPGQFTTIGVDEWGEVPFLVDREGAVTFVPAAGGAPYPAEGAWAEGTRPTAHRYKPQRRTLVYGTEDGRFFETAVEYEMRMEDGRRHVTAGVSPGPVVAIAAGEGPVLDIDFGGSDETRLALAIQRTAAGPRVRGVTLAQERSLFGGGEVSVGEAFDLTDHLNGQARRVLVAGNGEEALVLTSADVIHYFYKTDGGFELRQSFEPFGDLPDRTVTSADYLLGDVSVVVTNSSGAMRVFSLYETRPALRTFERTKDFPALSGGASYFSKSLRNKTFLTGAGRTASLRYATTTDIRWQAELPFEPVAAVINGKYESLAFLDASNRIHLYSLNDPHPEASWRAFFGKIWYEGAPRPDYVWQSSGGTDDFEPKLSLVPLIIGTLKGTFYAMLFALPVALLAAVYTSQFLRPSLRAVVKPTMEVMASLPSVVLGFLAALWLAPVIDTRIPSLLLMLVLVPLSAVGAGSAWSSLPHGARQRVPVGFEFLLYFPVFLAVAWGCWQLGPALDRVLFVATDPGTGARIADFRLWWPQVTHTPFEQRNSLVVGFVMGFAVIPIIFTIAEDSLSNVPPWVRSGSLALGASRWQTAMFVVLPTASAGIFSALMIGLGRAIGETMIVVMATGNTPIMDFNIFSGMRTLSANIAVELPEAPHHGTLYRTLFLGAMALFLATFLVNTLAEILRQHLREKYKTV